MDQYIDARFERLEKALASLIDSITKYNPSLSLCRELDSADTELSRGLEQVQLHQANHHRIQSLRAATASLDGQIRDTLSSLAATRRDLMSTPTTTFYDGATNKVRYDELLSYARRISKTTLPPPNTINPPAVSGGVADANGAVAVGTPGLPSATSPTDQPMPPSANPQGQDANGFLSQPNSAAPTPNPASAVLPSRTPNPAAAANSEQVQTSQLSENTALPEGLALHLNPLTDAMFFPWPAEDKIRAGTLAANQLLAEQGIEIRGYDPAEEEERKRKEEEERRQREEAERAEREERERIVREERERARREREKQMQEEWRRNSIAPGASNGVSTGGQTNGVSGPEKKQFQFTSMEDMDDDDDEED